MNKFIFIWLMIISFAVFGFGQSAKIKSKDLQILTGAQWTGTLTYLDYGTGKPVSIRSNLAVTQSNEDKSVFIFEYQYPNEPKADDKQTVSVSRDGKTFAGETVIERTKPAARTLKIVTEKSGTDNDKKALFRFTYLLDKNSFSIEKKVKYEGASDFFVRNNYVWKR